MLCKLYVIGHNEKVFDNIILPNMYEPLVVGCNGSNSEFNYDSTGDSIYELNSRWCELTGLYWIWKNTHYDIIGLCHYRRFFVSDIKLQMLNDKQVKKILRKKDVIVADGWRPKKTYYDIYCETHNKEDLEVVRNLLLNKYPEYVESFDRVLHGGNIYLFNMFVMKRELLNKYCEWLFPVLFELDSQIDVNGRSRYNRRAIGFIGEVLFTTYVFHWKLNVRETIVLNTSRNWTQKIYKRIKIVLIRLNLLNM